MTFRDMRGGLGKIFALKTPHRLPPASPSLLAHLRVARPARKKDAAKRDSAPFGGVLRNSEQFGGTCASPARFRARSATFARFVPVDLSTCQRTSPHNTRATCAFDAALAQKTVLALAPAAKIFPIFRK